jgi:hypothetical protein
VIQELLRVSPGKAWEVLRAYDDGKRGGARKLGKERKRNLSPPRGMGPLLPAHKKFLKSRRLSPHRLQKEGWKLKGTGPIATLLWKWRVVYPIRIRGRIVAYGGRSIKDKGKRKYNLTEDAGCLEDPRSLVYGLDLVPHETVLVVEGATDVWNMGPGAVGMFGIDWNPAQAERLRSFNRRFIMFDPEPIAQKKARELAEWLSFFSGSTELVEGTASDPGEFNRTLVKRIRKELRL